MLFWIFLVAFIIGIIWWMNVGIWDDGIPVILSVLCGIATIVMLSVICVNNIPAQGEVKASQARYESLVYQYENNLYDNDNDIGKKELMSEIQEWNEDLAFGKEMQRNLWIGIFIPNIFDEFEPINLDKEN